MLSSSAASKSSPIPRIEKGADIFVNGASSIAKKFKIPSVIIGSVLCAIATSLPELSVSLQASLAGMNDNSEYRYAWDCFFREELPLDETEDCINCTYVLSCSSMKQKDSLEMWRLYGDDGKGVCLIFDVDKPENPLLLAKTIYEFVHENGRKKLDNKWRLLKHLTTELNNIGIPLKLRNQNKWLPFFKSGDYHYENEVRLLYEENDESNNFHTSHDWVLNNANSIFTPYVQFDLSDKGEQQKTTFPLKLKGIVLGPKCPEKEMNAKQIKNMLRRDPSLQRLNIDIQVSKITNYR